MSLEARMDVLAPPAARASHARSDTPAMVLCGAASVCAWFTLFGMGLFINSKPYRDTLVLAWSAIDFVMSMLTFTPTNVGALCVTAAFIGGCASRLQVRNADKHRHSKPAEDDKAKDAPASESESEIYRNENPVSSALRGFVVFGTYIAGSLIADSDPFSSTSAAGYARAAGATSLAAFTVGFDPTFVYGLMGLRGRATQQK